jgi:hypothetical protein
VKDHAAPLRSDGERLTAAWLRQQGWHWEYGPKIEGRRSDFLAKSPGGLILLEVFEPELRLPQRTGSFDSMEPVVGAFEARKRKQIGAASAAELPLVIVIGSASSDLEYGIYSMAGAMFGRPGIQFRVGPTDPDPHARNVFLGGGRVQPQQFRSVSALAGIRRFNPTEWRLEAAAGSRGLDRENVQGRRQLSEWLRYRKDLEHELTERGVFDPSASLARLVVLHNPHTLRSLSPGLFGLYDEHYGDSSLTVSAPSDSSHLDVWRRSCRP